MWFHSGRSSRTALQIAHRQSLLALILGAIAIGFAPIFVRFSETGPSATAFWRMLLAFPGLILWRAFDRVAEPAGSKRLLWTIGPWFAADLALWHWSIKLTSVAAATLFANFAPIFVAAASFLFFREKIRRRFVISLFVTLVGVFLLVHNGHGGNAQSFRGNSLGLMAAGCYAAYLQSLKFLRARFSTVTILLWTGAISAPLLLAVAIASHEQIMPITSRGWPPLIALGLVSHLGGQGLIAFALARLPVTYSSLVLLVQPVVASVAAWLLVSEPLSALQIFGGLLILAGIAAARRETT
jgi:drug/metabolite transporter (DMT)-like permease